MMVEDSRQISVTNFWLTIAHVFIVLSVGGGGEGGERGGGEILLGGTHRRETTTD